MTIWAYSEANTNKAGWKFKHNLLMERNKRPLFFNDIGYVGIGTDVPTTTLHVVGK
jgi:hypothetical protein